MSNENPQVATPVVRLSYLLELKTAANYEDMFAQLVTLAPETKQWVEEEIRWAKSTLKKSNRITWWLRWVRLALVAGALNLAAQNKAEQNKEALEALLKKAARDAQTQPGAAPAYVTLRTTHRTLEHFYSLPVVGIQNLEPGYKTPAELVDEFTAIEQAWIEQSKGTLIPKSQDTKFIDFGNGWAWWLLPRAACSDEAKVMGHCGNSPQSGRTDRTILSLRQVRKIGDQERWEPHLTFILHTDGDDDERGTLGEMKGKGNAKPVKRYHPYIMRLLEDPRIEGIDGGGYLRENNFSFKDLTDEEQEQVRAANPDAYFSIEDLLTKKNIDLTRVAAKLGINRAREMEFKGQPGILIQEWTDPEAVVVDHGEESLKEMQGCVDGSMEFLAKHLLEAIEPSPAVFAAIARQINEEFDADLDTDPRSPQVVDAVLAHVADMDDGGESTLRTVLEEAYLRGDGWDTVTTFKQAIKAYVKDGLDFSDDTPGELHVTENDRVLHWVSASDLLDLATHHADEDDQEFYWYSFQVYGPNVDDGLRDPSAAEDVLIDKLRVTNLSGRKLEQRGQERLFKRPETDEEAQRDGIKTSYLLEPKTAASYDDMFKPLLALLPEAEPEVKAAIQWAKTTLRKADRITWYLRWARMEILLGYIHTPNPEQVVEYYQKLLREAMNKSGKSADDINLDLRHMQTSRTFFAHAYAMHLDAIENYIPKFELPSTLEDTFDEFERQAREAAKDDDKLLSPEDEDEIWLDLGKGWAWWFLDRDSCDAEGAAMGHCGNGSGKYTDRILSLRQHKKVAGEDYWEPHCTFILKPNGALGEMKGRNNEKPVERYHNAIVALLSDHRITMVLGGGYLPENNFSLSDLSSADREKVRKANPGLATTLYAAYKKHGIGAVEEAVEDSTEELEYVEDIGFVYETWRDKNAMIFDIGFEGRDLTTDVIETIFEDIEDGDPCLPNIVQSFLNEFPGKRTEIEQYDPNSAEAVMELIWNLSQSYGTESDTIERIVEDVVFCDAAVESMFYAWRSNHGSLESLTKAKTGDAWYLYADTYDLLEALDEGHSANIEWPTLNPEEMDKDTPVDFTGLLDALFTNPLPRSRDHNEVRLYPEPKSDAEAQRNGIRISHLLRAKAPRKTAASDEVERDAALRHEDEHAFVNHHYTGHINSESYDDKALDWQQLKSYPKLLKRVALKDSTEVDLRQSDEKLRYVKRDENGWTVRYEQGHPAHLSDEEIEAEGLPVYETAIMAFTDAGECVGMASDEFGADGVWVRSTFQGKGLGTILLTELRRQFRNVRRMGQMTPAGVALAQSYYRQMTGRKPTPKPVDPQLILSRFMGHVQWDKATPEQTAALREFYSRVEETDHDEPGKLFEEVLGWAKANWATPVLGDWSKRYMREGEMAKDGGYLRKQAGTKLTKDLLSQIAEQVRADLLPDRDAQNGDCDPISEAIVARLEALGIDAYVVSDSFLGLPHSWVQAGALWVDATRDQFAYEDVDDPDQYFDTPVVIGRGQMTKQAGKTAFVSPVSGELALTIENAARPKVTISLDLGIPNFTRFSIAVPVENLSNIEIDQFCRQAFEALLQNVTAFLISMKYNEDLIADVLANAEAAFMALGADDASDAGMPDRDASLRLYESSFELPEDFVMETRAKVVTASVVRRTPEIHKIELTPLDALATDETPARTIEFYLDQATKTTPRAFAVSVIEQTPSNKPARDWESRLLRKANKHRTAASAWYTPERVKYLVDWVTGVRDENSGYPRMGLRFTEYPYAVGETTRNSYHPVDHANTWSDDEPEYEEDIELDGTCCFDLGAGELGDIHNAIAAARSYGFGPSAAQHYVSVIGGSSSNDGLGVDGVDYGLAEQGAVCISDAKVLGTIDLRSNAG